MKKYFFISFLLFVFLSMNVYSAPPAPPPPPAATQAEAEAGTETELRGFSPLRVSQAIAALAQPLDATLTTVAAGLQENYIWLGNGSGEPAATGSLSMTITGGTASRAAEYNGSAVLGPSAVTTTELAFLDGIGYESISISPSALITDGTNCTTPSSEAINSGPTIWFTTCSDAAGTMEIGIPMPDNWDGGNIYVKMFAGSNQGTPAGTVEFEVQAMARGNDDLINSTWLSTVNLQFASNIDTQYDIVTAESAVIDCSGAAGDDMLFLKITRDNDDGTNDTSTQEIEVWGLKVYYAIDSLDNRD